MESNKKTMIDENSGRKQTNRQILKIEIRNLATQNICKQPIFFFD